MKYKKSFLLNQWPCPTDADYREMPKLFYLDDWEECLARQGEFCLGTFELLPHGNDRLFSVIEVKIAHLDSEINGSLSK